MITAPSLLPTFSSPRIVYARPKWHAYIPGRRGSVEVEASTAAEARYRAARRLNCSIVRIHVTRAYDPALLRFGARA